MRIKLAKRAVDCGFCKLLRVDILYVVFLGNAQNIFELVDLLINIVSRDQAVQHRPGGDTQQDNRHQRQERKPLPHHFPFPVKKFHASISLEKYRDVIILFKKGVKVKHHTLGQRNATSPVLVASMQFTGPVSIR